VVEFGGDFLLQRHPTRAYDISFPFNTVCKGVFGLEVWWWFGGVVVFCQRYNIF
jgi:hypothetical protein